MKLIEVILCFSQTIKAKSFLPCDYVRRYERRYGCRDDKASQSDVTTQHPQGMSSYVCRLTNVSRF